MEWAVAFGVLLGLYFIVSAAADRVVTKLGDVQEHGSSSNRLRQSSTNSTPISTVSIRTLILSAQRSAISSGHQWTTGDGVGGLNPSRRATIDPRRSAPRKFGPTSAAEVFDVDRQVQQSAARARSTRQLYRDPFEPRHAQRAPSSRQK